MKTQKCTVNQCKKLRLSVVVLVIALVALPVTQYILDLQKPIQASVVHSSQVCGARACDNYDEATQRVRMRQAGVLDYDKFTVQLVSFDSAGVTVRFTSKTGDNTGADSNSDSGLSLRPHGAAYPTKTATIGYNQPYSYGDEPGCCSWGFDNYQFTFTRR